MHGLLRPSQSSVARVYERHSLRRIQVAFSAERYSLQMLASACKCLQNLIYQLQLGGRCPETQYLYPLSLLVVEVFERCSTGVN